MQVGFVIYALMIFIIIIPDKKGGEEDAD